MQISTRVLGAKVRPETVANKVYDVVELLRCAGGEKDSQFLRFALRVSRHALEPILSALDRAEVTVESNGGR